MSQWELDRIENRTRQKLFDDLIKRGYFKRGKMTYVLHGLEYPHNEHCEGTMCWCDSRAKRKKLTSIEHSDDGDV